jgi:hypothetical protein
MLYERDPELREALAKSDINTIGLEDKFSIIEAYMSEGGVKDMQFHREEEEEDNEDIEISRALEQMSEKEK